MATAERSQYSPTGIVLREACIELGGITNNHLFRLLGLPFLHHGVRWFRPGPDGHGLGPPYGERLSHLLILRMRENRAGKPISESIVFDRSIRWPDFWLEREQAANAARMAS